MIFSRALRDTDWIRVQGTRPETSRPQQWLSMRQGHNMSHKSNSWFANITKKFKWQTLAVDDVGRLRTRKRPSLKKRQDETEYSRFKTVS